MNINYAIYRKQYQILMIPNKLPWHILAHIFILICYLLFTPLWANDIGLTKTESPVPFGKMSYIVTFGQDDTFHDIRMVRIDDSEPGLPGDWTDMHLSALADEGSKVEILQQYENVLTVRLPDEKFGMAVLFDHRSRYIETSLIINYPELQWLSQENASAGDTLRALGQNLVPIAYYPERNQDHVPVSHAGYIQHTTSVVLKDSKGEFHEADVIKASSYDVSFVVPAGLAEGTYEVFLHNGQGGRAGWSDSEPLRVQKSVSWPQEVFNVREYGADGNSINDDTEAIQLAIEDLRENGGGVLYFPAGGYHFKETLRLPDRTIVRGESRERSWLYMPDGFYTNATDDSATIGIAGEGALGLENLSMHAVYVKMMVVAPVGDTLPESWLDYSSVHGPYGKFTKRADGSYIRNCRLVQNATHLYHRRDDDPRQGYQESKLNLVVLLRGDGIEVSGSEFIGRQSCVYLCDSKYSRIANNEMHSGYGGNNIGLQHGSSGYEKVIIEDNYLSGFSPYHHGSVWMMHGGKYISMFRNEVDMKTWVSDNEGLLGHMWGYRLPFFIKKAYTNYIELDIEKWEAYWSKIRKNLPQLMKYTPFERNKKEQNDFSIYVGHELQVFRGKGLGQVNQVDRVEGNKIYFKSTFRTPLDKSSFLVVHDAPAFRHLVFADNKIEDTGQAIFLWGHSHESIIDGNTAKRTGPIGPWTVFHAYSVAGGCHFFQMINNYMDEGRYYNPGKHQPGGRYAQGGIGAHYSCENEWASSGGALNSVGYSVRNNLFVNDNSVNYGGYDYTWCSDKMSSSDEQNANPKDMVGLMFEDNSFHNAHYGMVFGSTVNAVISNNDFENVNIQILGQEYDGILNLDQKDLSESDNGK
jgi:hypothetical protein